MSRQNKSLLKKLNEFISSVYNSPKFRRLSPFLFLIFVGLALCYPLISSLVPYGDDILFHAYRYKGTVDAILDGQLIPQVDPQMFYGFGYSWNIFYGPLIPFIAAVFGLIGFSWPVIINSLVVASVLLSGIFMYRYIHEVSGRTIVGILAGVFYMSAPYHLFDIYSRQAHGEVFAFIFVPLIFHGLWRIINSTPKQGYILLILGASGLLMTHNLSTALVAVFSLIYLLTNITKIYKNWKIILKKLIISLVITLGISAFFTLPLLEARKQGIYNIFDPSYVATAMGATAGYLNSWRIDFIDYVINPNVFTEYSDSKPFALGFVALVSIAVIIFAYKRIPNTNKYFVLTSGVFAGISLLLGSKAIDWVYAPHSLLTIQFPWRFLFMTSFFISIFSAFSIYYFIIAMLSMFKMNRTILAKNILLVSLLLVTIASITVSANIVSDGYSRPKWSNDFVYSSLNGIGGGEYLPKTAALDDKKQSEEKIKAYLQQNGRSATSNSSDVRITQYAQKGTKTSFRVFSKQNDNITVTLPYTYYPGYQAKYKADSGQTILLTTQPSPDGFLTILLPIKSNGHITTWYGVSSATLIGAVISISTIIVCISLYALRQRSHRYVSRSHIK